MPGTLHIPDTQGVDCNDCMRCAGCVVWDGLGHGTETIQEACAFLLFFGGYIQGTACYQPWPFGKGHGTQ